MKLKPLFLASLLPLSLSIPFTAQTAHSQSLLELAGLSPYTHYKTFETEHFEFIYQDGYLEFTQLAAKHLEHAHTVLSPILKWTPRNKTTILVADNEDSANGLTMPVWRVGIVLIATPPDAWMSTAYAEDWIKLLVFHEYTHMLNIDPTTEWMEALRIIFGDAIRPNGLWPTWMLEGLAVYYETRTSTLGRGRSPYYDSILRAFYQEGKLGNRKDFGITLDRVNGDYPFFPGGEVPYLFGYHLWNQFAKDQNNDQKMGDYSMNSSHRVPYFIEGNLENVTQKNWIDYWDSFISESNTRFSDQIKKVKERGETKTDFITHAGYAAQGGVFSPDGKWLAYTKSSKERRQGLYLHELATGKETRVLDKMAGVGMSFSSDSRYLLFSALERYDTYSLFSDLYLYDLKRNRMQVLAHGARAKDPSFSPDNKKIVYIETSKASNWLKVANIDINEDGDAKISNAHDAYSPPSFSILGSPRFVTNDEVVFSYQELGKAQADLIITSENNSGSHVLLSDGKMNRYPYPTPEGILYISDLDGIENVYRIGADGNFRTKLSNVVTGANLPFSGPDGSLYASIMTSQGYEIARLSSEAASQFKIDDVIAQPSAPFSMSDALQSPELKFDRDQSRSYSPWSSLVPRQWGPIAYIGFGSEEGFSMGGLVLGFDSTGKQQYFGLAAYHFLPNTLDFSLDYTLYYFRPLINLSVSANTHDIGTGVNDDQYRRTYEVLASLAYPIQWTYSSLYPQIYGFVDWRGIYNLYSGAKLPSNDFEYSKPLVPGYGASVGFSRLERSRLGFMPEEGTELTLAGEAHVNVDEFTLYKYLARASQYIRVGDHSVLNPVARWLGSSRVTGFERGFSILEGRGNGITDDGTGSSLKRLELRGYSIPILAKSAGVASMDFHFPIDWIFSGLHNTAPAFIKQAHGFVFAESGFIPGTSKFGDIFLPSFGGGVSFDTKLLVWFPVTITLQMHNGTRTDFGGEQTFFLTLSSNPLAFF